MTPETPAPAALPLRPQPLPRPGRVTDPAGAGQGADRTAPAVTGSQDARALWKAALAAHNAALRRRVRRPRGGTYRAGMARRMPPPDGDDAA